MTAVEDHPTVTTSCEGMLPSEEPCREPMEEPDAYLRRSEQDFGLLLCRQCYDNYDNQGTPVDEESWKEQQWEWFSDR